MLIVQKYIKGGVCHAIHWYMKLINAWKIIIKIGIIASYVLVHNIICMEGQCLL